MLARAEHVISTALNRRYDRGQSNERGDVAEVNREVTRFLGLVIDNSDKWPKRNSAAYRLSKRAWSLLEAGQDEEALAVINSVIELWPEYSRPYVIRGAALSELHRYAEARDACDWAISREPDYAFAHALRGDALLKLELFDDALKASERVISLEPERSCLGLGWIIRAEALFELDRFEEARDACDYAVALRPNYDRAHTIHAEVLANLERDDEGLDASNRAIALWPADRRAHAIRVTVLFQLGRLEETVAAAGEAIAVWPGDSLVWLCRAGARLDLGRLEEALVDCDLALQYEADSAAAHALRGEVLEGLGRVPAAVLAYDTAIKLGFDEPEIVRHRDELVSALGQVPEAYSLAIWQHPELVSAHIAMIRELSPDKDPHIDVEINRSEYVLGISFNQAGENRPLRIAWRRDETTGALITECNLGELGGNLDHALTLYQKASVLFDITFETPAIVPSGGRQFDKGNKPVYTGEQNMRDLAAYYAVARKAYEKGLSVAELDEAIDDKLGAKAAARETTVRAKEPPRQEAKAEAAAPDSEAPADVSEQRLEWKDSKGKMALPEFVAKAYAAELEAGTLTKATLRGDFDLYTDYFNWRRKPNLPAEQYWLRDLPTKKQWSAKQPEPEPARLEEFDEGTQEAVRRYQRLRQRGYRRTHSAA
jgi:tetratricopeptide (TPR) repeat protein